MAADSPGLLDLAQRQHGAVSRKQFLGLGFSSSAIDRRISAGRLVILAPGVYAIAGSPNTTAQRRWVALLAVGHDAVLSFESAARIHRLSTVAANGPTVVTVGHSGWQQLPGITVHQINDLDSSDMVQHDGMPLTSVRRTVVDLAAIWRRGRLAIVVDDAIAAKQATLAEIGTCLRSVARRGKPGVRRLAAVLDQRGPGKAPPASELERAYFALVGRSSLPEPERQYPLPRVDGVKNLVDTAWPEVKLIVEVDGRRWHQRLADLKRDRDRDLHAGAAGWLVVRLMYEHVLGAPDETIRELRAVHVTRSHQLGSVA